MRLFVSKLLTNCFVILFAVATTLYGLPEGPQEQADKKLWAVFEELARSRNSKFVNLQPIRGILKDGANVNAQHPQTRLTILEYALDRRLPLSVVALLLEAKASVKAITFEDRTLKDWLFDRNDGNLIALLLRYGARVNALNLYDSIKAQRESIVRTLLKFGAFSNSEIQNGLEIALKGRSGLLDFSDKENSSNNSLRTMLQLLFVYGGRVDTETAYTIYKKVFPTEEEFLFIATREEQLESIRSALGRGVALNKQANNDFGTPLHTALSTKNELVVREFLQLPEIGALINVANGDGRTPLAVASATNNPAIVELLLKYGARAGIKLNIKDNEGNTPLAYAISSGALEIVELLIKAGAKPKNIRDALRKVSKDLPDRNSGEDELLAEFERTKLAVLKMFLRHSTSVYSITELRAAIQKIQLSQIEQDELISDALKNGILWQSLEMNQLENYSVFGDELLKAALMDKRGKVLAFLVTRAVLLGWYDSASRLFLYGASEFDKELRQSFYLSLISYHIRAKKQKIPHAVRNFIKLLAQQLLDPSYTDAKCHETLRMFVDDNLLNTQKVGLREATEILGSSLETAFGTSQEMLEFAIGQGHSSLVRLLLASTLSPHVRLHKSAQLLLNRINNSMGLEDQESRIERHKVIRTLLSNHMQACYNRVLLAGPKEDLSDQMKINAFIPDITTSIISFL